MKRLAFDSLTLTLANFGTVALGFVLSIVIARTLGVEEFGRYALAIAWAMALGLLADFGLATLLTRELAREPQQDASYLGASTLFKTALAVALMIALVIAAPLLTQDGATILAIRLSAPLVWLSAFYMSFTAIFRAMQRMTWILLVNVGGLVVQLAFGILLAARGASASEFVLLAVMIQATQLLAAWLLYRVSCVPRVGAHQKRVGAWELARASVPFAVAAGIGAVQMRAPFLLLGALINESAVGLYSAVARYPEAVKLAPGGFFGALFPALSQLAERPSELQHAFRRAEQLLLVFGVGSALGLMFAASPLITLTYGAAFAGGAPILMILGWTLVPFFWGQLMALYLYAVGDETFVNWIRMFGIGSQMLLSVPFMLAWGALGAALAVLLGEALMVLLYRWRYGQQQYTARWKPVR